MHTKDRLAGELRKAGLTALAEKAATGWYHDFLSPLAMPSQQLATDLSTYANAPSWPRRAEAKALLERHMNGEFDASQEESEAWAASQEGKETFAQLMERGGKSKPDSTRRPERLGDAPIEEAYREKMNAIATALDETFNGDAKAPNKKVGFVLLVFEYGDKSGRANYISNGANRRDIATLFREQIARFEGQAEVSGRA